MLKSSVLPPKVLGEDFVSTWGSMGGGHPCRIPFCENRGTPTSDCYRYRG